MNYKETSPINHCDAGVMHSQPWQEMRNRTAPVAGRGSGNKVSLDAAENERSPLNGSISGPCKKAAKKKFKVWPSAYASGWGVRCTKAGGPSKMGKSKK